MNVEQSVKRINELTHEMNASANNAEVAATRYQAHMALYNAAVQQGDDKEAEAQRLVVHAQVDAILDAGYEVYSRRRMISAIVRNVQE